MKIRFCGAARTTTGSMHVLSVNGKSVLLECGLYQGKRKVAFERNRNLPFRPNTIDAVVLSHAHIDHSGNLPSLVRAGYRGPVYATPATIDLCDIMPRDSAYLQMRDVQHVNKKRKRQGKTLFEPLYVQEDVDKLMTLFVPIDYETSKEITYGLTVTPHDAGHILGSALIEILVRENGKAHRILFTGDLGRKGMPILRDPVVVHDTEILITESTYGNRVHPPKKDVSARLRNLVNDICSRKSKLVIPAFSVGRTQQLVYFLDELYNDNEIPEIPVYVDSPLSTRATAVHEKHAECYDKEALERLHSGASPFSFGRLTFITEAEKSKELNNRPGPMVIISASGMCEGGRILHHIKNNVRNSNNIILFVGYQAQSTLGRYLIEGRSPIRIFGDEYPVAARVEKINALSAHADRNELMGYFREMNTRIDHAFVVHGEMEQAQALAAELKSFGVPNVLIPEKGQEVAI